MKPQAFRIARRILPLLIIGLASTFLLKGVFSIAQTTDEREIDDKIPKHVPIKVKIRNEKEKALKDLKNEKWVHDFELEVINTSNKPIYFLEIWADMPEIISENGRKVGFPLRYGRMDFVDFKTLAVAEDIPIRPGEVHVFKIPDNYRRGWEWHKKRESRPNPKKLELIFVQLSFGDGTGFNRIDGMPYPYKREESSSCRDAPSNQPHASQHKRVLN